MVTLFFFATIKFLIISCHDPRVNRLNFKLTYFILQNCKKGKPLNMDSAFEICVNKHVPEITIRFAHYSRKRRIGIKDFKLKNSGIYCYI